MGGIVPFTLASNAKFNTLRSGGLLNQWAILSSKQQGNNLPEANSLYSSQLKPDLGGMQLIGITDFNQEKAAGKSATESSLSTLKDGVYLLKVQENNDQKLIPYVKSTPIEVPENEIIQSEINGILKLKLPQEELIAVNIFDASKNLLKTVSQEQYTANGGIDTKDIDNQNNTFEIVTQYYNLQFKKVQTDRLLANKADILTKNRQIIARADQGIKNISIYSISGALILQQEVNKPEFESKSLESGIYIVQMIGTDGKTVNKKVKL
ncbi:T9SS type A sorting domain-containing protein [Chryseobacterium antibioticum]|uniref:T9SS type A sorting domain-containing protein n=1 Tax=Chryseobacterium antibioticum TaxID=2728847 RepID=UPI00293BA7CF|nr:T9SS type A sorting domain-containing protein [Chryseobacterium antibioticum]